MKSFAQKLAALTFAIALFTGCASSVTDVNMAEEPEQDQVEQVTPQPENEEFGTDADVSPIYDKPTMEEE